MALLLYVSNLLVTYTSYLQSFR